MLALNKNRNQNQERYFPEHEIIVSKTDTRGILTYANRTFLEIADYTLPEVIGKPHNILRHPDMPRCVFKLMWDRLKSGQEIFAYVVNRTKYGDYYWVFAHVTPTFDDSSQIIGYHSNRRSPKRGSIDAIKSLYAELLRVEQMASTPRDGIEKSSAALSAVLQQKNTSYDELVLSL